MHRVLLLEKEWFSSSSPDAVPLSLVLFSPEPPLLLRIRTITIIIIAKTKTIAPIINAFLRQGLHFGGGPGTYSSWDIFVFLLLFSFSFLFISLAF